MKAQEPDLLKTGKFKSVGEAAKARERAQKAVCELIQAREALIEVAANAEATLKELEPILGEKLALRPGTSPGIRGQQNPRKSDEIFAALEWFAAMCSHVPTKGEQMVRYYGYYSNVSRGQRKKANKDGLAPCILQPGEPSKGHRKNWARLI